MRYRIFLQNMEVIEGHDAEAEGFKMGVNEMSDWTHDEFGQVSGRFHQKERRPRVKSTPPKVLSTDDLPISVDWRT
jgi:hypothetical protein